MGHWATDFGIIIGDDSADIVGSGLDAILAECQLKLPGFTEQQFLATLAFVTGGVYDPNFHLQLVKEDTVEVPLDIVDRDALVTEIKAEITRDIRDGYVYHGVNSFAELHNYVDANEYGGFAEDPLPTIEDLNYIQGQVDLWLQSANAR